MKIIAGYIWALWWWRTSDPHTQVVDCTCKLHTLDGCRDGIALLRAAGLDELRNKGMERGIPASVPVDVIVNERVGHSASSLCVRHPGRGGVPSGALCAIGNGVYVFTPAYCVLQVAAMGGRLVAPDVDARFAVVVVAKVACEMCGKYSLAVDSGGSCGSIKRDPLTTVGELANVALSSPNVYGVALLRSALPWVVENTRSPKETDVALLMCLPLTLGGYGLPKPLSNFDLDVRSVRTGFFARWTVCNVDFYWPQARLVVEYDSREYHDEQGQAKVEADDQRADALRALGYTVITIRRNDLYSPQRFDDKIRQVADELLVELPEVTPEVAAARKTLRMMLLRHDRWA